MADNSAKIGFPYLAGEANAQALFNELVNMVQALLQGVEDRGLNTPPGSPNDGDSYIVGTAPTGAWTGRANSIAIWRAGSPGAWQFVPGEDDAGTPIPIGTDHTGLHVFVKDELLEYVWDATTSPPAWRTL